MGLRQRLTSRMGPFGRAVVVLAGATAASQGLTVIATPVLTRLYDPAEFGALAAFISILTIILSVASLRYELAVPLASDDGLAANVLVVALIVVGIVASVTALVAIPLAGEIASWINVPDLERFMWLLPLAVLAGGVYQGLSHWAIRRQDFKRIARTRVSQAIAQVSTQLALGILVAGPIGLLIGAVVGRFNGTGTLALAFWQKDKDVLEFINPAAMRAAASRYRRFPEISSGSALLNALGVQLPPLLLSVFYGAQVLGWFALGQRVIGLPMMIVGIAVAQVYFGHAAEYARTDIGKLRGLFYKTARRLAIGALIPILPLAVAGPWLFSHVFGPEWTEAGEYVRVLSVMYFVQFVAVPLGQTLNVFERLELQLFYDLVRLVLAAGAIIVAYALGWSPLAAVASYSVGMLVAYLLSFWLSRSMFTGPTIGDNAPA
jgi:O-antigen/teichoic acid export membrane protein